MKKILLYLFLLTSVQVFAAKTLYRITPPNFTSINKEFNHVVLDGNLIFQDLSDNSLWITDGTRTGTHQMLNNQQVIKIEPTVKSLVKIDNWIYYLEDTAYYFGTLWRTNGSQFEQISDNTLDKKTGITFKNRDYYFMSSNKDAIFKLTNNALTSVTQGYLINMEMASFCEVDNVSYIRGKLQESDDLSFFKFENGTASSFDTGIDFSYKVLLANLSVQSDSHCFYAHEPQVFPEFTRNYISIDSSGTTKDLNIQNTGSGLRQDWLFGFAFDGNAYFYPTFSLDSQYYKNLYKFTEESMTVVPGTSVFAAMNINVEASQDYFTTLTPFHFIGDPVPPDVPKYVLTSYNKNFEVINTYRFRSHPFAFKILQNNSFISYADNVVGFTTKLTSGEEVTETINVPNYKIATIVNDNNSTYLIGSENSSNASLILKVTDKAPVSTSLSGLWVAEGLASQGMSILTGTRSDNSQYMFISLYFYRNGQPLWVAGNRDYDAGTESITFDLFEYKGTSFIPNDVGLDDQKIAFGSLKLTPQSCSSMSAQFTLNNGVIDLNLTQLIKQDNTNTCSQ